MPIYGQMDLKTAIDIWPSENPEMYAIGKTLKYMCSAIFLLFEFVAQNIEYLSHLVMYVPK